MPDGKTPGKRLRAGQVECRHCSTPFTPGSDHSEFCCSGCQFVYELISSQGLDKFYDLQPSRLPPVKSLVFQKRDYTWLRDLVTATEQTAGALGIATLMLDLQGISCLGCVWLIEKLFQRRAGALSIQLQSTIGRLELKWTTGECDIVGFAQELQSFGYLVGPPGKQQVATHPLVKRMGLCAAFAMNAMLFTVPTYFGMTAASPAYTLFMRLAFVFASLSFATGGSYFFLRAWRSLKRGVLHIDLPIATGLIAAYVGSIYAWQAGATGFVYFDFVSTFSFLMLVGRWVQQTAVEKNRNRLLGSQSGPGEVTVLATGEKIAATHLEKSACYEVAPGAVIPVRSKLLSEGATLGLEWINGESEAQAARMGQLVPSGAVNCSQVAISLEAVESWSDSLLSSLFQIAPREHRQPELERFLRYYIAAVLVLAAAGFGFWFYGTHQLLPALQVLTSILVVSCPCAAGVALPLADEMAASQLRTAGVFVREQSLWSRILKVRKILFDKTGTLTLETMTLHNPEAVFALSSEERSVLLSMVNDNFHPVSCCLRETLMANGTRLANLAGVPEEIVGFGIELRTESDTWRLGRPGWPNTAQQNAMHDCEFSRDGVVVAQLRFADAVRPDAHDEVDALDRRGFQIHILSGDRQEKVNTMAMQLAIEPSRCKGGMTPQEKADWVKSIEQQDTLMIGDGANDSLAFNESFCTGTPAVDRGLLEHKADFYFLGRGLSGVRQLLDCARLRQRTVRRVIAFAISYNAVAIALSMQGNMSPLLASVLMPLSSLASIAIVLSSFGRRF